MKPEIWHIVDMGINHGRTHTLCGIEMNWTEIQPEDPETWCEECQELDA